MIEIRPTNTHKKDFKDFKTLIQTTILSLNSKPKKLNANEILTENGYKIAKLNSTKISLCKAQF